MSRAAFFLGLQFVAAQEGQYDMSCWVKVLSSGIGEKTGCAPCFLGQVDGTHCKQFDEDCVADNQQGCCDSIAPDQLMETCMDDWGPCRGATSFDPSHTTTNAQCKEWCLSGDSQFNSTCRLESFDYNPVLSIPDNNKIPTFGTYYLLWSTNSCYGNYMTNAQMTNIKELPANSVQDCQDSCALDLDCCLFDYGPYRDPSCFLWGGQNWPYWENMSINDEDCLGHNNAMESLMCDGHSTCIWSSNLIIGPPMCYEDFDYCHVGGDDVCHWGGNNPDIPTGTPSDTTTPKSDDTTTPKGDTTTPTGDTTTSKSSTAVNTVAC